MTENKARNCFVQNYKHRLRLPLLPKFSIENFSSVLNVLSPLPPTLLVAPQNLNAAEGAKDAIKKIMKGQVFLGADITPHQQAQLGKWSTD